MRTKHICPEVSITIRGQGGGRLSDESHHYRFQGHRHHPWHGLIKKI
jgi:hypothetical protein